MAHTSPTSIGRVVSRIALIAAVTVGGFVAQPVGVAGVAAATPCSPVSGPVSIGPAAYPGEFRRATIRGTNVRVRQTPSTASCHRSSIVPTDLLSVACYKAGTGPAGYSSLRWFYVQHERPGLFDYPVTGWTYSAFVGTNTMVPRCPAGI